MTRSKDKISGSARCGALYMKGPPFLENFTINMGGTRQIYNNGK
ncbi:hypothetical protein GCM10007416_28960 [Kroppenstedtia guangzhouensis]|uniref:Uncharacterized protein n=1 Tax=Kroppenstedtia guangzhouensis TaxID=1274356 RepID=A0ABQ1GZY3_9BACL|nr:hypothetical protein GCM10007416_28960 [Kroppenstedtia guangzhouensis]